MFQEINSMTAIVIVLVIVVVGAIAKSYLAIKKFLEDQFVKQTTCLNCRAEIKSEIYKDSNNKYLKVQEQIQKNHDEWTKEIKEIRKEAAERAEILARMDGKLDTLLGVRK